MHPPGRGIHTAIFLPLEVVGFLPGVEDTNTELALSVRFRPESLSLRFKGVPLPPCLRGWLGVLVATAVLPLVLRPVLDVLARRPLLLRRLLVTLVRRPLPRLGLRFGGPSESVLVRREGRRRPGVAVAALRLRCRPVPRLPRRVDGTEGTDGLRLPLVRRELAAGLRESLDRPLEGILRPLDLNNGK